MEEWIRTVDMVLEHRTAFDKKNLSANTEQVLPVPGYHFSSEILGIPPVSRSFRVTTALLEHAFQESMPKDIRTEANE